MLYGKEGIAVRMGVHRDVLCQSSAFFAVRLAGGHGPPAPCVEIHDCDDAEIYVETVGLMYCDEAKHRLLKQSVPRVLRIMKVAEVPGFHGCVKPYLACGGCGSKCACMLLQGITGLNSLGPIFTCKLHKHKKKHHNEYFDTCM
ncbi:BTB/POZ domain-containing protein At3g50780-like [Panicum virgatum]|uniref:BTB/POZ domain-containing protein At3g50780-like n=1 Tax=Panicum virgatum TaxID=38727 RepID=UPI0019D62E8E|nr:BTB/POZ domain-containing protein At3g50780-like [Panicum virgatum]